jgi:hypothetical protein
MRSKRQSTGSALRGVILAVHNAAVVLLTERQSLA